MSDTAIGATYAELILASSNFAEAKERFFDTKAALEELLSRLGSSEPATPFPLSVIKTLAVMEEEPDHEISSEDGYIGVFKEILARYGQSSKQENFLGFKWYENDLTSKRGAIDDFNQFKEVELLSKRQIGDKTLIFIGYTTDVRYSRQRPVDAVYFVAEEAIDFTR